MSEWKDLPPIKIGNPEINENFKLICYECNKEINYMPLGNLCNECWERLINE